MLLSFPGELLWIPPSLDYGNCRNHSWLKASGGIRIGQNAFFFVFWARQKRHCFAEHSAKLCHARECACKYAVKLYNRGHGNGHGGMDAPNFRISKVLMRDTSSYSFTAMERTVCWSAFTRFGCGVPSSSKVPFQTASTWICCQDIGMCHTFACRLRDLLEVP